LKKGNTRLAGPVESSGLPINLTYFDTFLPGFYLDWMAVQQKISNFQLLRLLTCIYFKGLGVFEHWATFWCAGSSGEALQRVGAGFLRSNEYWSLFSILDGLLPDSKRRYWIERKVMEMNISDMQVDYR
jgi:hypothetical protein